MKFRITFKTPDVIAEAIDSELGPNPLETCTKDNCSVRHCFCKGADSWYNNEKQLRKVANKFIQYGESVTIEFDTEDMSAKVIPV